jgi:hypothetical protein
MPPLISHVCYRAEPDIFLCGMNVYVKLIMNVHLDRSS